MKLVKKEILKQDISFLCQFINEAPCILDIQEHYRLLTYISKAFDNITIIDAGTCTGHSCICLAQNKNNSVLTYDINSFNDLRVLIYPNVKFKQLDILKESPEVILSSKIILLDIDPHDGIQERNFIELLLSIGYKGIVICDDIHLNTGMNNWWNSITIEKYDLTDIGHGSGTGLINFSEEKIEIE